MVVLSLAGLTGCAGVGASQQDRNPPPPGPVTMEVLFPPTGGQTFTDVSTYLINNSAAPVTGANFAVEWADIDQGPGSNPQYVWTSVDGEIQPWSAAGKKVNLVLWAVSDNTSNTATPQYVWNGLPSGETATCNGEQIPDYFDATNFQTSYLAFINAALQKYGSNSSIGYIRIGLGRGGETFPGRGFSPTGYGSVQFGRTGVDA